MKRVKHIIEFLFLFGINGLMYWFFQGYLNLLFAVAMLILVLYSTVSVHILKRMISLELDAPAEYVVKNTEFVVRISLKNRSILPLVNSKLYLRTGNTFSGEGAEHILAVPVKPRGETKLHIPLTSSYVGDVRVQAEKIMLEDLLGFHGVTIPLQASTNVYMIPTGSAEDDYVLNDFEKGMDEVEESRLTGSDFSDVSQVREYIPGDAMKNIHWKLSAKKDDLMVKERLHMSSRKLLVVLALERDNLKKLDETIERLYGFGSFMIKSRIPIRVFWWSDKFREVRIDAAESQEDWLRLMIQLFHGQAGDGFVEEHFRTMNPGKGYIQIDGDGIHVTG